METIVLDKKRYVVIEEKEYNKLQLLAAQKTPPVKTLTLAQGRKQAKKLIAKWANEK